MKRKEKNEMVKQNFAEALKENMKVKPFDKITVKELADACGLNRKTFYYHFDDIYDLLRWILEKEAMNVIGRFDMTTELQEAASFVLEYMEKNTYMIKCANSSSSSSVLKQFLYQDFLEIVSRNVDRMEKKMQLSVNQVYKQFVCSFCSNAIANMLINWIVEPKHVEKETIISYLDTFLMSAIPAALSAGAEKY